MVFIEFHKALNVINDLFSWGYTPYRSKKQTVFAGQLAIDRDPQRHDHPCLLSDRQSLSLFVGDADWQGHFI
jgi:hypothetical protein